MMFKEKPTPEQLNAFRHNTMMAQLGIVFTEVGKDFIRATMPVDHRTRQPAGILHGGASVALSETLASVGGLLCIDREKQYCVGLEINANHVKSAREGNVTGVARPVYLGRKTQVWETRIESDEGALISIGRVTLAVLEKRQAPTP